MKLRPSFSSAGALRGPPAASPAPADPAGGARTTGLRTITMTATDVSDEPTLATVASLLDDEHVRTILAATSDDPRSVNELSDRCDVSPSTIYRRVERMTDAGLLAERTRPRSDGHHETVFLATLDRVEISLEDGHLHTRVERRRSDPADQLTELWENF